MCLFYCLGDDDEQATIAGVTQGLSLDPTVQYHLRTDTSQTGK